MASISDDYKAIAAYMVRTKANNPKAEGLKANFGAWYRTQSTSVISQAMLNEAKKRRDAFNLANASPNIVSDTMNAAKKVATKVITVASPKPTPPPAAAAAPGPKPTLREGSSGDYVKVWQKNVGVNADGKFGAGTKAATIAWQRSRGLVADGIVGPASWNRYDLEQSGKAVQAALTGGAPKPVSGGVTLAQAQGAAASGVPLPYKDSVVPVATPGVKPTLREGSSGVAVQEWQRIVGVKDDGKFGPATKAATVAWQKSRALTADGIVGPNTWSRAQAESAAAVVMPAVNPMIAATQAAQAVAAVANQPVPHPTEVAQYAAAAVNGSAVPYVQTQYAPTPAPQSSSVIAAVTPPGIIDAINTAPTWAKALGGVAGLGALWGIGRIFRSTPKLRRAS